MNIEAGRSILRRAAELGRLAEEAQAAGNHRKAAELYRDALLLLQRHPTDAHDAGPAVSSFQRDGAPTALRTMNILATPGPDFHTPAGRPDGGE